jgi:hypothetical protein
MKWNWISEGDPARADIGDFMGSFLEHVPPAEGITQLAPHPAAEELTHEIMRAAAGAEPGSGRIERAKEAASAHISQNSALRRDQASELFDRALAQLDESRHDSIDQRQAASEVASAMQAGLTVPSVGASAELTKPAMLNAPGRTVFAAISWVGLILTIVFMGVFGRSGEVPAGFFVGLGLVGFLLVVALLVLVMGYGSVKMKASLGSQAGESQTKQKGAA